MSSPTANLQKIMHKSWIGLLVVTLMFGCDDYQREKGPQIIKFTGQAFGKNAAGTTVALGNFPVAISFYETYPPLEETPVTIQVLTDAEGRYIYPVIGGIYKGYSIGEAHSYYGSCDGTINPVGISDTLEVKTLNENNLSLCITSLFVIEKHRAVGSANTLHLSYKAKISSSTTISIPEYEITELPVIHLPFFPVVTEVEFTFTIKNSGEIVNTITETRIPVSGSTTVIGIDF